jgi:hypothetical protein
LIVAEIVRICTGSLLVGLAMFSRFIAQNILNQFLIKRRLMVG